MIHSPISRHFYFYSLKVFKNFYNPYYLSTVYTKLTLNPAIIVFPFRSLIFVFKSIMFFKIALMCFTLKKKTNGQRNPLIVFCRMVKVSVYSLCRPLLHGWFHRSPFKDFLLFFLFSDWLKLNHLSSRIN